MSKTLFFLTFMILLSSCIKPTIYPSPKSITILQTQQRLQYLSLESLCNLKSPQSISIVKNPSYYFQKVMSRLGKRFNECGNGQLLRGELEKIPINLLESLSLGKQGYRLQIGENSIQIVVSSDSGYIYAMQTLYQILKQSKTNTITYKIQTVKIEDEPLLEYRGIMIDTARHYISIPTIKRLLETMAVFKLNILHWHICDDQSFPLKLASHPQLAQSAYSEKETYSVGDLKELISLAGKNGIKIVPEIDTPSHVNSWGKNSVWKDKGVVKECGGAQGYNGQFNVSNPLAFQLVKDVVKEIDDIFVDSPYLHFGGDQVMSKCWDSIPEIKDFMKDKNLSTYGDLQMYWRKQLKSVLPEHRKVIFWRNNADGVSTEIDDVLHYWGSQNQTAKFVNGSQSKIVMSQSDLLYLNKGQGFIWGNFFGHYTVWKQLYQDLEVFPAGVQKDRILGGVACLWGQVSNEDTLENNLWMRAAAFADRVWSEEKMSLLDLAKSLISMQKTLIQMGVSPSPITSQFCEKYTDKCFGEASQKSMGKGIVDEELGAW